MKRSSNSRTMDWVVQQIEAGALPDIVYGWTPKRVAEEKEASGELAIVLWTDPGTGAQHRITSDDMPGAVLTAFRAQWDEAIARRSIKM